MLDSLTLEHVCAAQQRIAGDVVRTPVLPYRKENGALLLCKAESLQPVGAFKLRGAFNLMRTLDPAVCGVVAHSSGNHAQAVAHAGRVLGLRTVIVMPCDAPPLKRRRAEADGAEIITVGADSDERRDRAAALARTRGLVEVPPYDHPLVAAGQGTAALELLDELSGRPVENNRPPLVEDRGAQRVDKGGIVPVARGDAARSLRGGDVLDRFYCPVSGGGLLAGCATVVAARCPRAEIIGVEPLDGADTQKSLAAGRRLAVPPPRTIADGLRVRIPGERTFPVLKKYVSRIETVLDEEMLDAIVFALTELRLVLEPSGAAALAVALREGVGRCGVLLSGGNLDPALLARLTARGTGAGGWANSGVRNGAAAVGAAAMGHVSAEKGGAHTR